MSEGSLANQASFSILGFLPALVVQYLLEKKQNTRTHAILPEKQSINSVVMFADISGFTKLTETVSKIGQEGAEVIAFAINRYMELLVKGIGRSGGDIFKFAGDAMIVIWPPPAMDNTKTPQKAFANLLKQAIQSALDLQGKLNDTNILEGIKLSVKIGFGIGDMNIIHVGGVFNRTEYLATGDPLVQAFSSEHCCTAGGQTIISEQIYDFIENFFECSAVKDHPGHYQVSALKKNQLKVRMKADALLIKNNMNQMQFQQIRNEILAYIPAALAPFIEIDEERWSSELRMLTIMFVNLGIDLSDAKTEAGLAIIQQVISTVQKCIYMHEGSLNKLLMDDKGSTLIVVFGLPPMSHQDDAVRAVMCGFTLIRELSRIQCSCAVGVATGSVFAGVVGTSGSRREYSVLGDSVNLAARLMSCACSDKVNKLICCKDTVRDAEHKIYFEFLRMVLLKGKAFETPIFKPYDGDPTRLRDLNHLNYFPLLRTHTNNYPINDHYLVEPGVMTEFTEREIKGKQCFIYGREEQQKQLMSAVEKFMKGVDKKCLFVVKGTLGIGKTLLARKILTRVEEKIITSQYSHWKYGESPHIIVSGLDPSTRGLQFNGLRPILRGFLKLYSERIRKSPDASLFNVMVPVTNENRELYPFFYELMGLKDVEEVKMFPLVLDRYKLKKIYKQVKRMTIVFLSHYFEFVPEKYRGGGDDYKSTIAEKDIDQKSHRFQVKYSNCIAPVLLCFDDVHNCDKHTFKMIKFIMCQYDRVFILCLIRDQYQESSIFKKTKKSQEDIVMGGMAILETSLDNNQVQTICMKGLDRVNQVDEFVKLLRLHVDITNFTCEYEFETTSNNQQRIIKGLTKNLTIEKKNHDLNYLLYYQNKDLLIKSDIVLLLIQFIYLKTNGNPYITTNFFQELVKKNFLIINDRTAVISMELMQILANEETILIDPPRCRLKVNGPLIDRLSCLEQLLLKVASCIGEIFDIQTLSRINPFKSAVNTRMQKILDELECKDMIEVMEVQEYNIYYRFTNPFMRECIYMRMTYKQRRQAHISVAEAIQTLPQLFESEEVNESQKLQFHWGLSEQKWALGGEVEEVKRESATWSKNLLHFIALPIQLTMRLPNPFATSSHEVVVPEPEQKVEPMVSSKALRSIILKQIQTKLGRTNNDAATVIKEGYLDKKSNSNFTWVSRFCVLDGKEFRFYISEAEAKKKENPLSVITLKNIYYVEAMNDSQRYNKKNVFQLNCTSWVKKTQEKGERKFFFSVNLFEELEQWTIYLEFAKAKAVYDDFVGHYGKISFPIGSQLDFFDPGFRYDINMQKRGTFTSKTNDSLSALKQTMNMSRKSRGSKFSMAVKSLKYSSPEELAALNGFGISAIDYPLLKQRLLEFLQKSMMLFYSHVFEMSLQRDDDIMVFGQNTQCTKRIHHIFKINSNLMRIVQKHSIDSGVSQSESEANRQNKLQLVMSREGIRRSSNQSSKSDNWVDPKDAQLLQIIEEDDDKGDMSVFASDNERDQTDRRRSENITNQPNKQRFNLVIPVTINSPKSSITPRSSHQQSQQSNASLQASEPRPSQHRFELRNSFIQAQPVLGEENVAEDDECDPIGINRDLNSILGETWRQQPQKDSNHSDMTSSIHMRKVTSQIPSPQLKVKSSLKVQIATSPISSRSQIKESKESDRSSNSNSNVNQRQRQGDKAFFVPVNKRHSDTKN